MNKQNFLKNIYLTPQIRMTKDSCEQLFAVSSTPTHTGAEQVAGSGKIPMLDHSHGVTSVGLLWAAITDVRLHTAD